MNKHPFLKAFLRENATDYDIDVVFPGGDPVFTVLDAFGNELERTPLSDLKVPEIIKLIEDKGFGKLKKE